MVTSEFGPSQIGTYKLGPTYLVTNVSIWIIQIRTETNSARKSYEFHPCSSIVHLVRPASFRLDERGRLLVGWTTHADVLLLQY